MASCDNFRIEVEGVSSHGSTPHQGVDAILTAAYIITEIQAIVSRMNNPLNPLVVTVGKIEGGQRFNILADKVVLEELRVPIPLKCAKKQSLCSAESLKIQLIPWEQRLL